MHYEKLGVLSGWSYEQVVQLCVRLNVTEWELGWLCAIPWMEMTRWKKRNRFPPYVALKFKELESWYFGLITGIEQPVVVPMDLLVK